MKKMRFSDNREYTEYFVPPVEDERKAEMDTMISEIERLSGEKRQRLGRAILGLKAKYLGNALGGRYIVRFSRSDMPEHEITTGDVVIVSTGKPLKKGVEGTVLDIGRRYIDVAFDSPFPRSMLRSRNLRIDLYVNDTTFQRMIDAVKKMGTGKTLFPRDIILGKRPPHIEKEAVENWYIQELNEWQKEAVERALGSELTLIHGPPGTGKTLTLTEVILQAVERGMKVLVTGDSNNAVDNILENLLKWNIRAVRIGHPARVDPRLRARALDIMIESHPEYASVMSLRERIENLRIQRDREVRPSPAVRRGFSDEQIKTLARASRGMRGLNVKTIQSMARWIELNEAIQRLYAELSDRVDEITHRILTEADVILATNSSAGSELLASYIFDLVVIDEATQATEPSALIPLIKAPKAVLAGDHRQLPPTILSLKARERLEITLFERLHSLYSGAATMLRIQYRMNSTLCEFPSKMFYDGHLIPADEVKDISLKDIIPSLEGIPGGNNPIVFIDVHSSEKRREGSPSRYNVEEARIVAGIVKKLLNRGLKAEHIGVISPYEDQVITLDRMLSNLGVEVHTVDGFQGREKEVIIISFVRGNPHGNIGFLSDYRRLNVSITRAKRKLIIVGNAETLARDRIYRELVEYIKERGQYIVM